MRILFFFIYVSIVILGAYLDRTLFVGVQSLFLICSTVCVFFYKRKKIQTKLILKSSFFIIILFAVSSALFFALMNHKNEYIGSYNTFYNINLIDLLNACLLYPIIEEIIFRSYWLTYLYEKTSFTKSLIISSLGFSLAHFYSEIPLIYPFLLGLFLGWIYLKFKNIYVCIVFHILYNSTILLTNSIIETTNFIYWKKYTMIITFILMFLILRILYIMQKKTVP